MGDGKKQVTSAAETITVNEAIAQNESKLTPEVKSYVAKHKQQLQQLGNKSTSASSTVSLKKPSTWKISNLFPKKQKSSAGGSSDSGGWGIASIACSFVGLFFLGILFGLLGIIFGAIGFNKKLKGLAIAGLVLGLLEVILFIAAILFFAAAL